jgi:ribonuclease P protein component
MLPKKFRLHADKDIVSLVRRGKTFFLPQLTVKYQYNSLNLLRIGFVVSTKVDKRAVVRNKVKRRMREAIRLELAKINVGTDLLVIAKKSCTTMTMVDFQKQFQFALKTCRLYNDRDV